MKHNTAKYCQVSPLTGVVLVLIVVGVAAVNQTANFLQSEDAIKSNTKC
jgi:hypothetical protein